MTEIIEAELVADDPPTPSWRIVRPLGSYQLYGLAWVNDDSVWLRQLSRLPYPAATHGATLLAVDRIRGYLLLVNPENNHAEILNPYNAEDFLDAQGLCLWQETLWFCRAESVYVCQLPDFTPQVFTRLTYPVHGVTVDANGVYVTCQKSGYIHQLAHKTGDLIRKIPQPGIGPENLTLASNYLWVCDQLEQTVYQLDITTGKVQSAALTPFTNPTAISLDPEGNVWLTYAGEEPYLRDNPNNLNNPLELDYRDYTYIHPLVFQPNAADYYTLSNGYLIEMCYLEEISPLDETYLDNLEWRISLPVDTLRQRLIKAEPLGTPYQVETVGNHQVAVFHFPELRSPEARLFGWRAWVEVRGIKYHLTPDDVPRGESLSTEFAAKYLTDDDDLAMDHPLVQAAAREAIGTETNILRQMLKIRNYVYDRLSYSLTPMIDTPDVVLERGVGSCGEYVGVLLALARLNGIACRTVGRYKCPPTPEQIGIPLTATYNHVWLEFYVPGIGWLPMESNPDDVVERGPYPTRFFMGLPWYHIEMSKGIPFETTNYRDKGVRIGNLALNHVRFTILAELPPHSTS
ncbi:transglutaminase domain-containing protein [Synechococcus sp. PCC 6312]|uniref:transglutaminase domain-containing protein n=1 Tax=Synechococcus sp. (strain ATCC 27167 / PCC 6312) TaxID=195253 RepID=UPI00029ECB6E|nr:transglutaminase domain-containing protein [Synechococcus sp. PCC 6312]AFY62714.1 transglutaminase-like enzyme, predicted cysteine protease [Synechococcus sp. PCC 6312]